MIKVQGNDITAITACGHDIIKVVACGETVFEKTQPTPVLNMNWVDLGLPSGTLWADRNVGATGTTDAGCYFQWGGKSGYRAIDDSNLCMSVSRSNTPYIVNPTAATPSYSKYNTTDGLYIIEPSDDPCHEYFLDVCEGQNIPYGDGRGHSMNLAEYNELTANTTTSTTTVDGVTVLRFTGQNGNYIDFPYCGYVNMSQSFQTRYITNKAGEVDTKMGELNVTQYSFNKSYIIDSTAGGDLTATMWRFNLAPVRGCCDPDTPAIMNYRYTVVSGNQTTTVECDEPDYQSGTISSMTRVDIASHGYFSNDSVEELYIGDCTKKLESALCSNMTGLTKVVMSNSVVDVSGGGTFHNCKSLTSVTISTGLTVIYGTMFSNCTSLTSITIPSTITLIEDDAFTDSGLIDVDIPSSVTEIEQNAFYNCPNLNSITMHTSTPPTGGASMFGDYFANLTIYVPQGSISAYESAQHWDWYAGHYVEY